MKQLCLSLLFASALYACAPPTAFPSVSQARNAQGELVGPIVTATAIPFDASRQDIPQVIDDLLDRRTCNKTDYLTPQPPAGSEGFRGYEIGEPVFRQDPETREVDASDLLEVADDGSGRWRAFVVAEPSPTFYCASCVRTQLYVQRRGDTMLQRIEWRGYQPSRVLGNLLWIGDSILTLTQSTGPQSAEVIGVDVERRRFVYYSAVSCY